MFSSRSETTEEVYGGQDDGKDGKQGYAEFSYQMRPDCSYSTRYEKSCQTVFPARGATEEESQKARQSKLRCRELKKLFEYCQGRGNRGEVEVERKETITDEPVSSSENNFFEFRRFGDVESFGRKGNSDMFSEFENFSNIFRDHGGQPGPGFFDLFQGMNEFFQAFNGGQEGFRSNGESSRNRMTQRRQEEFKHKQNGRIYGNYLVSGQVEEI